MKRLLGILLVCAPILAVPQVAGAGISWIIITPARPFQNDHVTIEVMGGFADLCWRVASTTCDSIRGQDIFLSVRGLDAYADSMGCFQLVMPYDFSCDYPPLAPGTYTVRVTEYRDSLRNPGQMTRDQTFEVRQAPSRLTLAPNPFNGSTAITYGLPGAGRAKLAIYDARGRQVATLVDADLPAGGAVAEWRGTNDRGESVPAGVYFARLRTAVGVQAVKVTLAK